MKTYKTFAEALEENRPEELEYDMSINKWVIKKEYREY